MAVRKPRRNIGTEGPTLFIYYIGPLFRFARTSNHIRWGASIFLTPQLIPCQNSQLLLCIADCLTTHILTPPWEKFVLGFISAGLHIPKIQNVYLLGDFLSSRDNCSFSERPVKPSHLVVQHLRHSHLMNSSICLDAMSHILVCFFLLITKNENIVSTSDIITWFAAKLKIED